MSLTNQELIERLPHKYPMRLIHRVVSVDSLKAICETDVGSSIVELFPSNGELDTCVGVELLAQSAAIPLLFESGSNAPMQGMLVQIKRFESYRRCVPTGATLVTKTTLEKLSEGTFTMAHGNVYFNDQLICEGTITLAVQATS